MRAWAVLAGWGVILGCTQTDVIARDKIAACTDGGVCADAAANTDGGQPTCRARVCADFDGLPSRCSDSNSHVSLGDSCSDADPARPASRFALCTCTDFVSSHALRTDAWESSDGGSPSTTEASVAINGEFAATGSLDITGSLLVAGSINLDSSAGQTVTDVVMERAPAACACDSAGFLDVAQLVAAHAEPEANDNPQLDFDPGLLDGFDLVANAAPIELLCGRYYFASLHGTGPLVLRVTGHAAIFVAGDLAVDDDFTIELGPSSSVDLFVAGNVRASGRFTLGAVSQAGRARMYVGGSGTLDIQSEAMIAGSLYAPRAELVTRGTLTVYGSLFVRRAAPLGDIALHYDVSQRSSVSCEVEPNP